MEDFKDQLTELLMKAHEQSLRREEIALKESMRQIYSLEQFKELAKEIQSHETAIMEQKAREYTDGADKLYQFRQVAGWMDMDPAKVAMIYLLKHIQSIASAVETGIYNWCWRDKDGNEGMKERIVDARNLLLLVAACMDEESTVKKSGRRNSGRMV